nr:DUF4113 domain-containing protein [Pseudomonas migulae]
MSVLDEINGRWGKGVLRVASVPAAPGWAMRRELMSQSYTTRVDQLWTVKARVTGRHKPTALCVTGTP